MGALDVYCDTAGGLDGEDERTGLLLASHAAIAMAASRKAANLRIALDSRDLIGQAKRILIERYKIDGGQAFDLLIRSSPTTHQKLRDVAAYLVHTGEIPLPPPR